MLLALLLPAVALGQAASPRAEVHGAAASATQDIVLDASSTQIDYGANRLTFADVTVTQGDMRIRADRAVANGTDRKFEDSNWEFSGNVRINFETGTLLANKASVRFVANRVVLTSAVGTPAEFEQKLANMPRPVRGHASNIDYDVVAQTIRLRDDAWMFDGRNEMTSPALVYDIRAQRAQNETPPGTSGRVHITIRPDTPVEAPAPATGRP